MAILKTTNRPYWIAPLILGLVGFFIIASPGILIPTNIAWLQNGDASTYFLGWDFFRYSPWTLPLGLNPHYGLELSNSIVYSDSNPLLALFFKPFSGLLPAPFQYFGMWVLGCILLQTWFGWKLISLVSSDKKIQLIGAAFFLFSPTMIWRLHPYILHLNLAAHFLILWALYLTFKPKAKHRWGSWCILIALSTLIHAYLLAMILALFYADLLDRRKHQEITPNQSQIIILIVCAIVGSLAWLAGYFSSGRYIAMIGYGSDQVNLLTLIDPGKSEYGLWSQLLPNLPGEGLGHESFNYLGLGMIFLALILVPRVILRPPEFKKAFQEKPYFYIVIILFAVFAISNHIRIGNFEWDIPLPEIIVNAAGIFRSSARMFWPPFYLMYFFILYGIVKYFPSKSATLILVLALAIQVIDTSGGRQVIKEGMEVEPSSTWNNPMKSDFWNEAAKHYEKVRWLKPGQLHEKWKQVAYYSALNHKATDSTYLARIDLSKFMIVQAQAELAIATGKYEPDTLYIIEDSTVEEVKAHLNQSTDLLQNIDGFNVLAPKWYSKTSNKH